MNPRNMIFAVTPLDDLQVEIGALIEESKSKGLPLSAHMLMSISEHLKDAKRWQYVAENTAQWNGHEPCTTTDFCKLVDEYLEIEHDRLVRARQGRADGVPRS